MKKLILTSITFLSLIVSGKAQSHVWEISKGGNKLYLGGTIHALRATDFPLPKAYDQAFEKADALVFETDMDALKNPEVVQKMMTQGVYADGSTLETKLKPETYTEFKKVCETMNIPVGMVHTFKPFMAVTMMSMQKLMQLGFQPGGIDQLYFDKATTAQKKKLYFETPEEQITALLTSGEGNEDDLILKSCDDLKNIETIINKMVDALKTGNADHLTKEVDRTKNEYPSVYKTLLKDRNAKWLAKIPSYVNTKEIELILVGALHLYGNDGLLEQLKKQGYQVKALN